MPDTIKTKQCSKCKEIKPVSEYYPSKITKSKCRSDCKQCVSKYYKSKIGRAARRKYVNSEHGKKVHKKWMQTEKAHNLFLKQYRKTWYQKIKHKFNVAQNLRYRIRIGKIPHPSIYYCSYCNNQAQVYHHHKGYSEEHKYDVIPICKSCHTSIHFGHMNPKFIQNVFRIFQGR